ncbi:sugar ABC transporter permease [Microbacterium sp. 13-71-7]|jgi:alpha-glucoside transport system permease protein|uniref:carbohydrate ABC transporter permease n=1 Tax=Microbacterium sp. 13-71-7 TaxID=1970399 RepID=UPI000BD45538|nr:sugar ABC transporter permease [Microbacterium sp. 13-71-7]OZB84022.1 MAG: ABC transporter permease [Microbacterium sp. 13-71-7]
MSQTTMSPPTSTASPRSGRTTASRSVTIGAMVVGAIAIIGVFLALLVSPEPETPVPTSLGFSLKSFFVWIGGLNPLLQIPIVLVVFAVVATILLLLIEYAPRHGKGYFWLRLVACFVIPVLAFMLLRPYQNSLIYVLIIALVAGGMLFFADYRAREGAGYTLQLVLFMAPAGLLLIIGLIYPAVSTVIQSFFDKTGKDFVALENYQWVFTNPEGFWSVINTLIWALIAPIVSTIFGLAYAVFIDRARGEKILKVFVFMPFAISFVGAGIIWKFIYDYRQGDQIGLLNAIVTMFGGKPIGWLDTTPLVNTICLLIVFIWTQTGFAMVILSAAIKAVPTEQIEAASLDGANAWERFRNVTVPGIRSSLIVVLTTITIASLKVYDIVAVMTGGRANSTVLGFEMVNQQQRFQSYGHSSALAVVLFLFVLPLIIYNARQIRKQREIR